MAVWFRYSHTTRVSLCVLPWHILPLLKVLFFHFGELVGWHKQRASVQCVHSHKAPNLCINSLLVCSWTLRCACTNLATATQAVNALWRQAHADALEMHGHNAPSFIHCWRTESSDRSRLRGRKGKDAKDAYTLHGITHICRQTHTISAQPTLPCSCLFLNSSIYCIHAHCSVAWYMYTSYNQGNTSGAEHADEGGQPHSLSDAWQHSDASFQSNNSVPKPEKQNNNTAITSFIGVLLGRHAQCIYTSQSHSCHNCDSGYMNQNLPSWWRSIKTSSYLPVTTSSTASSN